ncbi:TetR family transcriptional regulator [Paraburkholderia sacchari]|uniref:hypothetical protein n=1 Tax=Paraburkholderia sacchari TaxID=159450 RepID=UPI0039A657A4
MNDPTIDNVTGQRTHERLRLALHELAQRQAAGEIQAPTVTALCELAKVSRNTFYRYHRDLLYDLTKLQRRQISSRRSANQNDMSLREENATLHDRIAKLAALVDHYYVAWKEARSLLDRRERELSELRRTASTKVVGLKSDRQARNTGG